MFMKVFKIQILSTHRSTLHVNSAADCNEYPAYSAFATDEFGLWTQYSGVLSECYITSAIARGKKLISIVHGEASRMSGNNVSMSKTLSHYLKRDTLRSTGTS